jgi:hypothetical protein
VSGRKAPVKKIVSTFFVENVQRKPHVFDEALVKEFHKFQNVIN